MTRRGVFAVDRGLWDDPDFADEAFSEREAWTWLVGQAAWRRTKVRVGRAQIELRRGECAFSTRFMAQAWKWSEARVRRFLKRLTKCSKIDAASDAHATRITICNYNAFQVVGLPPDALGDAEATQKRRKEETGKQINISSEAKASSDRSHDHAAAKAQLEADFAAWWEVQPQKVGKPKAKTAYLAARKRGVTADLLLGGLERYIATKPDWQQFAHPTTWLNREGWEDAPAPKPTVAGGPGRPSSGSAAERRVEGWGSLANAFDEIQTRGRFAEAAETRRRQHAEAVRPAEDPGAGDTHRHELDLPARRMSG